MTNAPPIGLKPRKIHDEQRLFEIFDAIRRQICAGNAIPEEWYNELYWLLTRFRKDQPGGYYCE